MARKYSDIKKKKKKFSLRDNKYSIARRKKKKIEQLRESKKEDD